MSVDLYSPVLMCAQFAKPVVKPTPAALAKAVARSWVDEWELGDKNVDALAATFVNGLGLQPSAALGYSLDDAIASVRATIKAAKDAVSTLALDDETAKGIRKDGTFWVRRLPAPDASAPK